MELTFASYNIRKTVGLDRKRDPERILSVLHEIGADVVALQEADRRFGQRPTTLPRQLLEEHHWQIAPVSLRPLSIGWHGNALLVRKGVEVEESHALHLPTLEPRGAVAATLRIGEDRLRIVGMHLDISGLRRRQQARAILHHVAAGEALPTILMGDCNEWRNRGGCLTDFGERHHMVDTGHSFHSRKPVARLDRIFASPELEAVDAGVHQSALAARASDHLPIWARFKPAD